MLMPSEDSNIASDRLASAKPADGVRRAPSSAAYSAMTDTITSFGNPTAGDLSRRMTWRKAQYLHFIRAPDATSRYARPMARPDLNLLVTLDVLLAEGSVARAAQRLRL